MGVTACAQESLNAIGQIQTICLSRLLGSQGKTQKGLRTRCAGWISAERRIFTLMIDFHTFFQNLGNFRPR